MYNKFVPSFSNRNVHDRFASEISMLVEISVTIGIDSVCVHENVYRAFPLQFAALALPFSLSYVVLDNDIDGHT